MLSVYRSDDVGAPVLNGFPGTLITVLDACLVNGYGDKPAVGWAKVFSDVNKAVYRPPAGNRFYLRVDDTAYYNATLVGYRQMTDLNTGVGPFPTVAQFLNGLNLYRSNSSSSDRRAWLLLATDRVLLFWYGFAYLDHVGVSTSCDTFFFGDCPSYLANDGMLTLIVGRTAGSSSTSYTHFANRMGVSSASTGHYLASDFTQLGSAVQCGILQGRPWSSTTSGTIGPPFPDPITGGMLLDRMRILETGGNSSLMRGLIPGVFNILHPYPCAHLDRLQGRGLLQDREFLLLQTGGANGRYAVSLHEDDWRLVV